jgi:2-oxoisovalerate dehydrogenase E1 component alpha subunit
MSEASEPSRDVMVKAFRTMALGRAVDERCVNLQRQGRIGFYVQSEGQEAAQAGCGLAVDPGDWLFPAYRELIVALSRGIPLKTLIEQFFGNSDDELKGRQMPCHYGYREYRYVSPSSPVGTQIIQAVGFAMGLRYRGEKAVTVAFFGDGGTSANDFHAGMNFAGVYKAPVIFFCQNNGWAISLPREKQTKSPTLAMKAEAYGFPGVKVDGNDFAEVYRAVREARQRAFEGKGPTLIEAETFRIGAHSTSDDPSRYRSTSLLLSWKEKDPIDRLRKVLVERGWQTESEADSVRDEARAEVQKMIQDVEHAPPMDPSSMFDDVTKDQSLQLAEELAEFKEMIRDGVLKQ